MNYFVLDIGGSSIKYAVMDGNQNFLEKGKIESRHLKTLEEFIARLKNLYHANGSCEGGIAISYCGEVDASNGFLHSGGSYWFMAGNNLRVLLEKECGTSVSVENDGNCAGYQAKLGFPHYRCRLAGKGIW